MTSLDANEMWSGTTAYPSWDALVADTANGWVAVAILRERAPTQSLFTWVVGPFPTRREAHNARARLRAKFKRDLKRDGYIAAELVTIGVRPAWKDVTT